MNKQRGPRTVQILVSVHCPTPRFYPDFRSFLGVQAGETSMGKGLHMSPHASAECYYYV